MKHWAHLLCAFVSLVPGALFAHELQPGYLELREAAAGRYEVLWKQPSVGGARMLIAPVFPDDCRQFGEARTDRVDTAFVSSARIECATPLSGRTIAIEGLEAFATDVLLRVQHADGAVETHVLKPIEPAVTLRSASDARRGVATYLYLGIEHILLGIDHLLFVLGLLLIVRDRWMLLKTITAFTLAHSITLAVATFGVAQVAAAPLNAAIALSILFLGPEVVRTWRGQSSFTIRHPWVVAFAFGLLHGFGFASGLAALGLPQGEIPLALLLFNVGVEIGQLAFVLVVILLERSFRILEIHWPKIVEHLPGYAVGTLGALWAIQRLAIILRGVT